MIEPACGTGEFLIAMFLTIVEHFAEMPREQRDHLHHHALHGSDIVHGDPARRHEHAAPQRGAIAER